MDLNLTYNNNSLSENITRKLIDYARNKIIVPPSFLITLLHYEGLWGGSAVARQNNNWGGMTWSSGWTNPHKRSSGVTVTRGSSRPSNESGYYIKYDSEDDFLSDWFYLFRRGGIYKVADKDTFDSAVKGMFKYGGSTYDYATMNVSTSKQRYELYLSGMKARRNAINNANNSALDKIDNKEDGGETIDPPDDTWDKEDIVDNIKDKFDELKKDLEEGIQNISTAIETLFSSDVVKYGDSLFLANGMIKITKSGNFNYKITPNGNFMNILKDLNLDSNDKVGNIQDDLDNITKPKDPQDPPIEDNVNTGKSQPSYPTVPSRKVSSIYGWRTHPISGKRSFHTGTDFSGGGVTHPIYSTQDGEVVVNKWNNLSGWYVIVKHTKSGDSYFSAYQHLRVQSPITVGTNVKAGQKIGDMGTTGSSTGIHLHFEIATSQGGFWTQAGTIDPQKYLKMYF